MMIMYSFRLSSLSFLLMIFSAGFCFAQGPLVQPVSAVSRQTHGTAGAFDINLPLTGTPGIECRSASSYQIVLGFLHSVTFDAVAVTAGTGSVTATGSGTNQVILSLTGLTNGQTMGVTLHAVKDGTYANDVSVRMSLLLGDAGGNGTVNASDRALVQSQSGQPVTASNCREDLTVNGSIDGSDVALAGARSGSGLPTTTFTFNLDSAYKTSAGIFKSDGTLIRTLWRNATYGPGPTTRTWDGNDDNGAAVPSGSYQVKLLYHSVQYVGMALLGILPLR